LITLAAPVVGSQPAHGRGGTSPDAITNAQVMFR